MVTQGKRFPCLYPVWSTPQPGRGGFGLHFKDEETTLEGCNARPRSCGRCGGLCAHTRLTSSPLHEPLYPWLLIKAVPVSQNQQETPLCYFRLKMESMISQQEGRLARPLPGCMFSVFSTAEWAQCCCPPSRPAFSPLLFFVSFFLPSISADCAGPPHRAKGESDTDALALRSSQSRGGVRDISKHHMVWPVLP